METQFVWIETNESIFSETYNNFDTIIGNYQITFFRFHHLHKIFFIISPKPE